MRIANIEIIQLRLPMVRQLSTGFGVIASKDEMIIKLTTTEGLEGYGEAAILLEPVYTHESLETCITVISKYIAPRILGKEFNTVEEFRDAYHDIVGNRLAKAGVECAFWNLVALRDGVSLKKLFGGVQDAIPVGESVGVKEEISELLKDVEDYLAQGFLRIKVKIKPGWDKVPLRTIRKRWPDVALSADANAAYTLSEHKDLLCSLDQFNLTMLEQPLAFDDFVDHAALQLAMKTPICLDESIKSLNDAHTAVALGSCKIFNVKPGRVGGILESIAIHDFATKHGIGLWCGGMLETGIGRAFNIALASKADFVYPADMSPSNSFYSDDVLESRIALQKDGTIKVSDKPGLGYAIDKQKLKKYTVNSIIIN